MTPVVLVLAYGYFAAIACEAYLVAIEIIGSVAWARYAHQQAGVVLAVAFFLEFYIDIDRAACYILLVNELGAIVCSHRHLVAVCLPFSFVQIEMFEVGAGSGFLEALAKNFLVVQSSVNLVIYILDA